MESGGSRTMSRDITASGLDVGMSLESQKGNLGSRQGGPSHGVHSGDGVLGKG